MMEIIFRGKRIDNGEWTYGALIDGENHCLIGEKIRFSPYKENECKIDGYEVDRDTVCQYTGLTDRDGNKIFDGDILDFINEYKGMNTKFKHKVEFRNGAFVCGAIEEDGSYNNFDSWNVPFVKWRIIGNIFDNPELLTED